MSPPTVMRGEPTAVGQTQATLNATVDPNGAEVGDCRFEYGSLVFYEASAPCAPSPGGGLSPVPVSATLEGLAPE